MKEGTTVLHVLGERAFPPASGLTYCTWFCVDKFSSSQTDCHPVRLLTICRHLQYRDDNLVCFAIYLSAKDRSLIISTQEQPLLTSAQGCLSRHVSCYSVWQTLLLSFLLCSSTWSVLLNWNDYIGCGSHFFSVCFPRRIHTNTVQNCMKCEVFSVQCGSVWE